MFASIVRQDVLRVATRRMSTSVSGNSVSSSKSMNSAEAITKLASVAALAGAGVAILLSPENGDADFLDCQNHCHDEHCEENHPH